MSNDKKINQVYLRKFATATNDLGTFDTYRGRLVYSAVAYHMVPENLKPIIKDFNFDETILYGRVNKEFQPIMPDETKLQAITGQDRQYALSFVALACDEFLKDIRFAIENGKISNNSFLENLKVKRAYVPQGARQISTIETSAATYISFYSQTEKINKIMNMDQLVASFQNYLLEYARTGMISSPAFVMSKMYSPNGTGLCIDFDDSKFSDDTVKMQFIDSPGFQYYLTCAARYGFYVDKNYPLRLVSNLSSPTTKKFISATGQKSTDLDSIFENYYKLAHENDIDILKNLFFITYQNIQQSRPEQKINFIEDGNLFSMFEKREIPDPAGFQETYGTDYWLRVYVKIRNRESKLDYHQSRLNKITESAIKYNEKFDMLTAMNYINKEFLSVPISEGSYNDRATRFGLKARGTMPDQAEIDYLQYLKENYKTR